MPTVALTVLALAADPTADHLGGFSVGSPLPSSGFSISSDGSRVTVANVAGVQGELTLQPCGGKIHTVAFQTTYLWMAGGCDHPNCHPDPGAAGKLVHGTLAEALSHAGWVPLFDYADEDQGEGYREASTTEVWERAGAARSLALLGRVSTVDGLKIRAAQVTLSTVNTTPCTAGL